METLFFLIYNISLAAALLCVWIKWIQDEDREKVEKLEAQISLLDKDLKDISLTLKRLETKNVFGKK